MRFHFLTGLPRAGSTLLASIFNQNPRFHASIQSPVGQVVTDMVSGMGPRNESGSFFKPGQREAMVRAAVEAFYEPLQGVKGLVFDSNRRWTANASLLNACFPDSFMLACVRDPRAIVDSFERLFQRNPVEPSVIYGGLANTTVYGRVEEVMKTNGVLGFSLAALRSAFFGPFKNRLLLVEYDSLARFPKEVLADVYQMLGEEPFDHDFNKIEPIPGADVFDRDVSTPGLHDLKPSVVYEPRQSILPPDIVQMLPGPFWRANEPVTSHG